MTDILAIVLRIALAIAPGIKAAYDAGTAEAALTATLVAATKAAELAAKARIDARAGHATSPLLVEAEHHDDARVRLAALGQIVLAADAASIARELRRKAAAVAPTDPVPSDR